MRHNLSIACYIAALLLQTLTVSTFSFFRYPERQQRDSKSSVLEQLHPTPAESAPPKGIRLLPGYKHKSATDFEGNNAGEIWRDGGLKIRYEMGLSQGQAVDANAKNKYRWYREQVVNGRVIKCALDKNKVLIITVPLDNAPNTYQAANFYGDIKEPTDIADMLLMILPFAQ